MVMNRNVIFNYPQLIHIMWIYLCKVIHFLVDKFCAKIWHICLTKKIITYIMENDIFHKNRLFEDSNIQYLVRRCKGYENDISA